MRRMRQSADGSHQCISPASTKAAIAIAPSYAHLKACILPTSSHTYFNLKTRSTSVPFILPLNASLDVWGTEDPQPMPRRILPVGPWQRVSPRAQSVLLVLQAFDARSLVWRLCSRAALVLRECRISRSSLANAHVHAQVERPRRDSKTGATNGSSRKLIVQNANGKHANITRGPFFACATPRR